MHILVEGDQKVRPIRNEEELNEVVKSAAKVLAPHFGVDLSDSVSFPTVGFYKNYQHLMYESFRDIAIERAVYLKTPSSKLINFNELSIDELFFIDKDMKCYSLIPDVFMLFPNGIEEGNAIIGHEVSHWLHDKRQPTLFNLSTNDVDLPKELIDLDSPRLHPPTLHVGCIARMGERVYRSGIKSLNGLPFSLSELLSMKINEVYEHKRELTWLFYHQL